MNFGYSIPLGHINQVHFRAIDGRIKYFLFALVQVSHALAVPLTQYHDLVKENQPAEKEFNIWLNLLIAAILVLAGGAFAGLTIALMGQDGVYLQVIATSGEGTQQRHAQSVHKLLQRGKHWVLVTLLLSNVIVNETLPIVLDRSLGGGWPAVLGSTLLIVIFGEVIPQSVCVRYGLSIGAFMAPCVLGLMWILAPVAWPVAKLLDILLGKDHGTVYKKSGLKTLVTLHKTLGTSPTERLNQDEVTIISAVLDLKDKAVGDIMTPIDNVFTMSEDTILNEETMNTILSAGYSRIPIYEPGNPYNFVGMLLVKILITYDPQDCKKVSEFALATLPETRPETSCLDIVNFFQEGKSHMALVSEYPAENYGAIGVVTLEDVIEELIGEEIIDESDVYIDVHKAIRRLTPAPKARTLKPHVVDSDDSATQTPEKDLIDLTENKSKLTSHDSKDPLTISGSTVSAYREASSKITLTRRLSEGTEGSSHITVRRDSADVREHLKHLGPSNLASRPKSTRYSTVKIKNGYLQSRNNLNDISITQSDNHHVDLRRETIPEESSKLTTHPNNLINPITDVKVKADELTVKEIKIPKKAGNSGYGSFDNCKLMPERMVAVDGVTEDDNPNSTLLKLSYSLSRSFSGYTTSHSSQGSEKVNSSHSRNSNSVDNTTRKSRIVTSGSITENIVEAGGIQKLVIETSSSGEELEQTKISSPTQPNQEICKSLAAQQNIQDEGMQISERDQLISSNHQSKNGEQRKKRRKNKSRQKG